MWRLVVPLLLAVLLTGCGSMFDSNPPSTGEGDRGHGTPGELGVLLERRDAEQVLADRDRMIAELMAELTRVVPGSQWRLNRAASSTPCGEFGSTDGKTYTSKHFVSDTPVPAALWDQASQAVVDIAARYGYTDVTSRTENATDGAARNLDIADADGGVLTFGSVAASSGYVKTGCYLTAEDKRKARDAAPK
jgi:hypothetical protein